MRNNTHKRPLALLLCAALLWGQTGATAYGEEGPPAAGGLCRHHTEHTGCGYVETVSGSPCRYQNDSGQAHGEGAVVGGHTGECYGEQLICGYSGEEIQTASGSDAGHRHGLECRQLDCPYEGGEHKVNGGEAHREGAGHDDACGYVEAAAGNPCGYVCDLCGQSQKDSAAEGANSQKTPPIPGGPKGENLEPEGKGDFTVTSFEELDSDIQVQSVPLQAPQSTLNLPATLSASGYSAAGDTSPVTETVTIQDVTWELTGRENTPTQFEEGRTDPCSYYFQPLLPPGYQLAGDAVLPEIEVRYGWGYRGSRLSNGSGYSYDGNGQLTITNNSGTTAWRRSVTPENVTSVVFQGQITAIGNGAFEGCSSLTSIILPDNITSMGYNAFKDCSSLNNVILPDNITYLANGVFEGCSSLTSIILPDNIASMGYSVFKDCSSLNNVILPDNITSLANGTFEGCSSLTSIILPDNVASMGYNAFKDCSSLNNVILPDNITSLANGTFEGCSSLTSIILPDNVASIEYNAFKDCSSLSNVIMPDNITFIGRNAFEGCSSLTNISLPDNLDSLQLHTFKDCSSLNNVTIPDNITTLDSNAFVNCTSLTSLTFTSSTAPRLLTYVGPPFDGCDNLVIFVPPGSVGYTYTNNNKWPDSRIVSGAALSALTFSAGTLAPDFHPATESYTLSLPTGTPRVAVTPTAPHKNSAITVNGNDVASGVSSADISFKWGDTITVAVEISATDRRAYTVTVLQEAVPVSGVKLNQTAYTLYTNKHPRTFKLTAAVEPYYATNKTVLWNSSDTNVATVDSDGKVTAIAPGSALITATTDDGGKTASCTVTVETGSSGGYSGGGTGDGGGDLVTAPQPPKPNHPVTALVETPLTVENGTAAGKLEDGPTAEALAQAEKDPRAGENGIAVRYDLKAPGAFHGFSITIPRDTLDRLIAARVKGLTVNTGMVDLTFDLAALEEIQRQTTGDVTLTAARETALTGEALAAMGHRPAYRLTVRGTGRDGQPATVTYFGAGRVTLGLAYTPAETEQTGGLFLVYGDGMGGAQWLDRSGYHRGSGRVMGSTGHFSLFGVGYKPAPLFADTAGHWAKADIDFAVSRGLMAGVSETAFSPDSAVTRAALVTALGRLAGIDPAAYPPSGRFTDVPAAVSWAPFAEWAVSQGIVSGGGEESFYPEGTVARQELALIMQRYADKLGYALPVAREGELFADDNQIAGDAYRRAIQAMQQAGIMNGVPQGTLSSAGGKIHSEGSFHFRPRDNATRAETAAVLRRFVEIVTDRAAAAGWGQNDAGGWLYYENSRPAAGWREIGGRWYWFDGLGLMAAGGWRQIGADWYYFYPDGSMAADTAIDGYKIGPDGRLIQ